MFIPLLRFSASAWVNFDNSNLPPKSHIRDTNNNGYALHLQSLWVCHFTGQKDFSGAKVKDPEAGESPRLWCRAGVSAKVLLLEQEAEEAVGDVTEEKGEGWPVRGAWPGTAGPGWRPLGGENGCSWQPAKKRGHWLYNHMGWNSAKKARDSLLEPLTPRS